ncbi:MAG: gamma-glutamylcyclotransferase family protein [Candidatus Binatia bacterium]
MTDATSDALWYFAYGSNMQRATFCERRGLVPTSSAWARLVGYRLCFDLAVGSGERGVANLVADSDASVHGVLHRITRVQAERLDRSEGVHRGYYDRIVVSALVEGARSVPAFTYASGHGVGGRKPSARYMGLLIEGAEEHALPAGYLDYLRSFELAVDERTLPGTA